jgi:hypothetical protein
MIEYQIMSSCGGGSRLGVNSNGNLTKLTSADDSDPHNIWQLSIALSPGGAPLAAAIVNKATGTRLQVPNSGSDNRVELGPIGLWDDWSTWTFQPPPGEGGPEVAVRPFGDGDLNLNVKGGCDSLDLCVWGWGGGQGNERWTFVPNGNRVPDSYYIISKCGGYLALDSALQRVILTNDASVQSTSRAVWHVEIENTTSTGGPGCTVANAAAYDPTLNPPGNQFLAYAGSDVDVSTSSWPNVPDSWTFAGVNIWILLASGSSVETAAIRPTSDGNQNLNVSGGCGNTEIITWGWGGGADNEIWYFQLVGS